MLLFNQFRLDFSSYLLVAMIRSEQDSSKPYVFPCFRPLAIKDKSAKDIYALVRLHSWEFGVSRTVGVSRTKESMDKDEGGEFHVDIRYRVSRTSLGSQGRQLKSR